MSDMPQFRRKIDFFKVAATVKGKFPDILQAFGQGQFFRPLAPVESVLTYTYDALGYHARPTARNEFSRMDRRKTVVFASVIFVAFVNHYFLQVDAVGKYPVAYVSHVFMNKYFFEVAETTETKIRQKSTLFGNGNFFGVLVETNPFYLRLRSYRPVVERNPYFAFPEFEGNQIRHFHPHIYVATQENAFAQTTQAVGQERFFQIFTESERSLSDILQAFRKSDFGETFAICKSLTTYPVNARREKNGTQRIA